MYMADRLEQRHEGKEETVRDRGREEKERGREGGEEGRREGGKDRVGRIIIKSSS